MNTILMEYFKELTLLQNESEIRKEQADRYMKEALQLRSLALNDINKYQLHAEFIYGRAIIYPKLEQQVIICDTKMKQINTLHYLLTKLNLDRDAREEKILVYTKNTNRCKFITSYMDQSGIQIKQINSETTPMDARSILQYDIEGNGIVMLTAELDKYNLKVDKVKYIINLDCPNSVKTYVERIITNAAKSKYVKVLTLLERSSEMYDFHEKYLRELLDNTECSNEMIGSDEYTKAKRMLVFSDISASDSESIED